METQRCSQVYLSMAGVIDRPPFCSLPVSRLAPPVILNPCLSSSRETSLQMQYPHSHPSRDPCLIKSSNLRPASGHSDNELCCILTLIAHPLQQIYKLTNHQVS